MFLTAVYTGKDIYGLKKGHTYDITLKNGYIPSPDPMGYGHIQGKIATIWVGPAKIHIPFNKREWRTASGERITV